MNSSRAALQAFVAESNRIEGIGLVLETEVDAHKALLELPEIRVQELEQFVSDVAGRPLRDQPGMDVRVGGHTPPPGGPEIREGLAELLGDIAHTDATPWECHVNYERLHPFLDGNGRSGRALWAWQRIREDRAPFALGFLHSAYYEALEMARP